MSIRSRTLVLMAAALVSMSAQAAPLTYEFTGVVKPGPFFAGQTVSGFLTVDPSLYTWTRTTATAAEGFLSKASPALSGVAGQFALAGGFSFTLGGADTLNQAESFVYTQLNGFNRNTFTVDGGSGKPDGSSASIQLTTASDDPSPFAMFPGVSTTDVSLSQSVAFNTPGSTNTGFFSVHETNGDMQFGYFTITSVTGSGIAAVPEVQTSVLMLMGVAGMGCALRRRHIAQT